MTSPGINSPMRAHSGESLMVTTRHRSSSKQRAGFSLLELLAVVTILGIIAVVVIPRVSVSAEAAKTNAHKQNVAEINGAVERWYFEKGKYPKADLSDIGADANYFPDGIPTNPLTDNAYKLNAKSRVE